MEIEKEVEQQKEERNHERMVEMLPKVMSASAQPPRMPYYISHPTYDTTHDAYDM